MPSKTRKQAPETREKMGISKKAAKEFVQADQRKSLAERLFGK